MKTLTCILLAVVLGLGVSARAGVTGQWDFNGGLSASTGLPLEAVGAAATGSQFGTTTSFGIPDIGGQVAQVMRFPALPTSADGYKMYPNAAANGSTADVNQYSLVMDVLYPASSTGYRALFQTSSGNSTDGDWFVNPGNGLGISSQYSGNLTAGTWHRIALVVDLEQADATKKFQSYIDGALVGYADLGANGAPGGRWAVFTASNGSPSWIFSDEDGETALGYVNSVQFSDYAMSAAEIGLLGGPSAAGIPVVPEPAAGLLGLVLLGLVTRRVAR